MKSVKKLQLRSAIVYCAVFLFSILYSVNGFANVYVPTTFTDPAFTSINNATGVITGGAGIGLISLRSALTAADNIGGTHTVTLSTGTYNLTQAIPNREITIGNTPQNITINGNGPTNTIISNTLDADKDRILFINPVGTTNSPVISVNGIRFQNAYLSSDPYGGAAICAGGGSAESLTITNCTFDNNVIPANGYGGAAVCMQVRGDLTIDNCTFTNNVSNDADGGAVLFIIYNSALGTGFGTLNVTNSTFTGNSVIFPGAPTSNGGALAFTGQGGCTPYNATINNNTFINNTADGLGGAIVANNSPNVSIPQIHYNRFLGNSAAASAASGALHFAESSGSVNADNNWWACNSGPTASPCDRAGGDVPGGGTLTLSKWLQLKTTASPSTICNTAGTGNTSTITTSFLTNSANEAITTANLSRLIGLTVTWGPTTLGTLSSQQTTIQASGTATATFTSNGTGGVATVNTQVDNVPSSETSPSRANITVNTASVAPTGATGATTVCSGGSTTLTVSGGTKGTAAVTQWYTGSCGGALVFTGDALNTGALVATTTYFVRYNGTCNVTTCATVTVNVNDVTGGTVAADQTICSGGDPAAFTESVASTGSGVLTYQWQSSTTNCASGFSNIGSATGATYDPPSGLLATTFYHRVTTSTLNAVPCTATSNCITVTVNNVTGGTVAADQTICSGGDPAAFTQIVASTGSGALTYQWQSSTTNCSSGFSDIGGETGTTYDPPAGLMATTYYRRVTTSTQNGVPCTANSNCVTVTVNPNNTITLTSAPGTDLQTVTINTAIIPITYSTTGATGATFSGLPPGVTGNWASNVVTISGSPTSLGVYNYTVTLTGGCGVITAMGTITVNPPPTNIIINDVTMNEGTGGTTTSFVFTVTRSDNINAFSLTVNTADLTATSPSDYTAISGGSVSFTAGGSLTATVTVLVNQDNVVENNETFNVLLSGAPAGVVIVDGSGLGTITNDDNTSLTLSMTGGSALTEGSTFTFLASLTNPVQGGFKVAYINADGTATTADNDYTAASGMLTFAGSASETQSFTVASTADNKVELNETFTGALGAISNTSAVQVAAITIGGSPQTATINNDDGAVVSIAANVSGSEATTPQTFSVTLSNPVDVPVTVNFNTSNGSATTADMDYNAIVNQTVTFPANTTTTQTVNVTINNDNKVEDNEVYNVAIGTLAASGRNVSLGTNSGTGTINNDDAATVTLSGGASQNEGNTGTTNFIFTATLNNPVQGGFTVAYTTNDGTATTADNDYLINAGGLAFLGNASETKTVTVMVNGDHKVEANETFTVSLGALSNSTAVQLAAITKSGSPQTGTILNDEIDFGDAPDTYATLLASNGARHATLFGFQLGATIDGEDDGQPNANATGDDGDEDGVTLPGSLITGTNANVTVNASANGKLDAWVDFDNNGSWSAAEKIFNNVALVAGNNNLSFAVPPGATPANTFSRWRFSSAGGLAPTGLAADGEVEDYQIQIINTLFSINNPTVAEGNAGTANLVFTISRSNNSNTCSVNYAITGGTATTADNDYQVLAAGTANFTTGGSLTQTVTVVVNGDVKVELDESVIMTLSNPVNGSIQTGTGTGTITNDDAAVITITNPSINEPDAGSSNLVFDVTMSNPSDANVSFNYATADGTATLANNDYTNTSGSHIMTPGQTTKQISVPIIGDCTNEANEIFTVLLSSLNNSGRAVTFSGSGSTLSGTGTILNEDFIPVITCPSNMSFSNGIDTCGKKVNYLTPVGTDDCPGPTTTQTTGLASGSLFPVGTTTNTFKVTDNTSNTATCSFTVTITDSQKPTVTCPANAMRGTDEGFCKYTISGTEFNATATDNCGIAPPLTYTYIGPTSGSGSATLNTVMFNKGLYTVTWQATDVNSNTGSCSLTVDVKDNELPKITCPADKTVITAPGTCTVSGLALGTPTTSDNCGVATTTNNAPGTYQVGITLVIWKVTDVNGNTATCTQKITVIPYSCGMPTQVYHTDTTATTAKVKWLAGKCATSYELRIRVEVTPGVWGAWSAWTPANGILQHQFTGLTPIKFYNYQIRTICGTTNSVSINDWFWTLPSFGTNLQNRIAILNENSIPENPMSLVFVPNPARDFTTVLIEGFEQHEKTITMLDLYGKLVFNVKVEPKQNQLELDLTTLGVHTGVYLIRVSDDRKQKTEQLMIER